MKCDCNKCKHQHCSFRAYNSDGDCERCFWCDIKEEEDYEKSCMTDECDVFEEKDGDK